jgi:eukaryotic-like serine/threonine-protein kinase
MGEVYRATDSVLQRKVAVKLLSERHARDDEVRARFRREALSAARLSGAPHVITVFDVGEHETQPYIVMEYLEGGSVFDRQREGRVPPELALDWLAQAGEALDRAHAAGIVHRDVKPANLLLDRDGSVVVSDFGIASTTGLDTLTLPGTVLGTAGYLSPEQARGEPATAASDRYGLAVVAFELLAGRRPFAGDTAATEAFAHVTAPVPSAETIDPRLPEGVDEVFSRALAKDPADRPATCAEFVADLSAAFRSAAPPTRVAPPLQVPVPRTQQPTRKLHRTGRRPPKRLVLAGLAVAGLGLGAFLGSTRDEDLPQQSARPPASTTTQRETTTEPTTQEPTETTVADDGVALNDRGFALMQDGEYGRARPLLERSVDALRGTGSLTEAYASYNLAYTRFALGSCNGVLPLLDRSEALQGKRKEIDQLRSDWEDRCTDCDEGAGKGKGKGRGKGNDD